MLSGMGTVTGAAVNGVALRAFRELQTPAISQEALAKRVGITQGHYSKIESGANPNPNPALVRAIALNLGIPVGAITVPDACPTCTRKGSRSEVAA
jgi:transcriptional regulator with XRE-family HTH domain